MVLVVILALVSVEGFEPHRGKFWISAVAVEVPRVGGKYPYVRSFVLFAPINSSYPTRFVDESRLRKHSPLKLHRCRVQMSFLAFGVDRTS